MNLLKIECKIYDKLLNLKLIEFLEENDKISNSQYGFRKGIKTIDVIKRVVIEVKSNKERKLHIVLITLVTSYAFNTALLINVLKSLVRKGINKYLYLLLSEYLKNIKIISHGKEYKESTRI